MKRLLAGASALALVAGLLIGLGGPIAEAYQGGTRVVPNNQADPRLGPVTMYNGDAPLYTMTSTQGTKVAAPDGGAQNTLDASRYNAGTYQPDPGAKSATMRLFPDPTGCTVGQQCNRGSITITFPQPVLNPRLNIGDLGGAVDQRRYAAQYDLTTPGVTMSRLSGTNLTVTDTQIRATDTARAGAGSCTGGGGCGTIQFNGLITSLTFDMSINSTGQAGRIPQAFEGIVMQFLLDEDFGDAPASYDQNNAARAIVGDLRLGANDDIRDHPLDTSGSRYNSTASPKAGANAEGDNDNAFASPQLQDATAGSPYRLTVPISGASKAGTVCGWIDYDRGGTFNDDSGEEACADFEEGATSVDLQWDIPSNASVGDSYARFRVGYERTFTSRPTGPAQTGEVEDYRIRITAPSPELTIEKSASPEQYGAVGDTITYTFLVTNSGNVTLSNVQPKEGEFSGSGQLGEITPDPVTLEPGEEQSFTAEYTITQADLDAGEVTNTATATGNTPGGGQVESPPDDARVEAEPDPALELVKNGELDNEYAVGETITYTFVVRNTGNVTLTDVQPVEGDFSGSGELGPITPDPVTLAPGEEQTFTAEYTLTQADLDAGEVTNTATAKGTPPGGDPVESPPDDARVPGEPDPSLEIVKSADPSSFKGAGETITYAFTVTNTGNVTLTEVAPVEGDFSGSGELGPITPDPVTLAPGESQEFTAEYVTTAEDVEAGSITNSATSRGTPPDGSPVDSPPSEAEVPFEPAPALELKKTAELDGDYAVGETVTYKFLVTNTGNVTLTDVQPVEGDFSGSGELGPISPDPVTLAPGESQEFTAQYTLTQADVDAGEVTNTATATGTPPEGDPVESPPDDAKVPGESRPALTIEKRGRWNTMAMSAPAGEMTPMANANDQVLYTFWIENTGNVTLTNVRPAETSFSGTGELGEMTPESVTLAPGEGASFRVTYRATQEDIDAGYIDNEAKAVGDTPDGSEVESPPDDARVTTDPEPAIELEKSAELDGEYAVGETVTYTFVVTNTGNVTLTDVQPEEGDFSGSGELGPIRPDPVTLAPGEQATFTAEYTLTQADVDAGEVTNTATANGTPPDGDPVESPPDDARVPGGEPEPGLEIEKSADLEKFTAAGETITYTFVVTNTGNVTLSDVAPVETDFSGSGELGPISPESATIAPGEQATFTAQYVTTQADVDAGEITNAASARGKTPDGSDAPPPDPADARVPSDPSPALEIEKTADPQSFSEPGETITYTFLVRNTGNVTLTDVAPEESEFSGSGDLGPITPDPVTLSPGQEQEFTAEYVTTQADVDAGEITNSATANGTPPDGPPVEAPPSDARVPGDPEPGLSVEKTADKQSFAAAGETITYTFVVTNTGNVTLTEVAPTEAEFSGSGELGPISPDPVTLAPGESATFTAEYVTTQEDVDAGEVTNAASAEGTPPPGAGDVPPPPPSRVEVPSDPDPSLELVKNAELQGDYAVGETVTYTFVIRNTGNVTLTDVAPEEGEFSGTGELGPITPESATLRPGEEATFTAEYTLTQEDVDAGEVTNTATGNGTPPDGPPVQSPPDDARVPGDPEPGLSIEKSSDKETFTGPGETITYSFLVTNTGNVTLTDVAPTETEFSGSGELGPISPDPVTLAPGASQTFTAEYVTTQEDVDAGEITNAASAEGTPPPAAGELPPPTPSEVRVPFDPNPSLELVKSAALEGDYAAGETVTYTFVIRNTGNVPLTDVAPEEGEFSGSGELGPITPDPVTLAPGEEATFTAEYTLTQEDVDAGEVTNTATGNGTPPDGPPVQSPPDDARVPGDPEPGLSIEKSADKQSFEAAGEEITYSFVVTNTGNVTLTDVTPTETEFSGSGELGPMSQDPVTLAPGASETFTAVYVTTQEDVDAGEITNAASATGTPPPGAGDVPPPTPSEVRVPGDPKPGLSIEKSSDKQSYSAAGEEITYTFVVTNTGNVTLTDVTPTETEFSGSGELGPMSPDPVTLAPGESQTFTAVYVTTQEDVDAGEITNAASATGTPPPASGEVPPPTPSEVRVPGDPQPGLTLVKEAQLQGEYRAGETVTYTFVIRNTGNVTLTDVAPEEGEFSGTGELGPITPESATLQPGEEATFTAEYTLTQEDVDAGEVTNTATGNGTPPDGPQVESPPDDARVPGDPEPGLSIEKSSDKQSFESAGEKITYSFVVTNTGNVTLTDVAPTETEFSGSGELGPISPDPVTLAPGASQTFTAEYVTTQEDVDAGEITNAASAEGTPPPGAGDVPPPTPSEVRVPGDPEPGLSLVKAAELQGDYAVGETVTYRFVVRNTGNVTLTDVAPQEGDFSGSGELGPITPEPVTLAPGEQETFTADYTLTQEDVDAGEVTNTATGNGTPPDGPPVQSPPDDARVPGDPEPGLSIEKSADKQSFEAAGEEITYSFVVTNTGNVTLTDVAPTETEFSGSGELGPMSPDPVTLAPGESQTFTAVYVTTQEDVDAGEITNAASATGTPPPGTGDVPPPPPSRVEVPSDPDPALELVKNAELQGDYAVGETVTYTFVIRNTGNVTLTEVAPEEGEFSGTGELGPITPQSVTLQPGEEATFTAEYTLTQEDVDAGEVTNTATGNGTPPDGPPVQSPPDDARVPGDPEPGLSIEKSADKQSFAAAGEEITYSFLVTNTGNVTLTDVAPTEVEFSGSGELGPMSPDPVTLAPGASQTFTAVYVTTQEDVDAGEITNAASATGTPPPGAGDVPPPPPSEVRVPFDPSPSLELVKSAELNGDYKAGETVTYTFVIRNTGNVTLTDVAPVEGEFSGTGELGPITPGPVTLQPGEEATFTADYTLTQEDADAGEVTNTATGRGTPPDGPPVESPPDDARVPGDPQPGLSVEKTADKSSFKAGEKITYSFVVKNTGNVTLTDVAPVETEFSGSGELGPITPDPVTLAPGESETFTATYVTTEEDAAAGKVTNAASATGTPPPGSGEVPPTPPSRVEVPSEDPDDAQPGLTLVKGATMRGDYAVGETVKYSFVITNTGNVPLSDVQPIEGEFSGTGEFGPITPGPVTLQPGEEATFSADYTLTQEDADAGEVTNTATGRGTPPDGPPVDSPPSEARVPGDPKPGLSIVKTADVEKFTAAGETITYTFVVTNTGNVELTEVAPVETEFSGTGELGAITPDPVTLAPGASATFTAKYVTTEADVAAGKVTNAASATGTPPPGAGEVPPPPPSQVEVPSEPRTPAPTTPTSPVNPGPPVPGLPPTGGSFNGMLPLLPLMLMMIGASMMVLGLRHRGRHA